MRQKGLCKPWSLCCMKRGESQIVLEFNKLGHFWLDSGLVGLHKLLNSVEADITLNETQGKLVLQGSKEELEKALRSAYNILVDRYYNTSTQKQKEDVSSYNFYYDSKTGTFQKFPKRKSRGIAEIIYNKAPRPTGTVVKWAQKSEKKQEVVSDDKKLKRHVAFLPESHAHLQERMDFFLNTNNLDITTSGLLIDGPNMVAPKTNIKIETSTAKIKGNCYLCGEPSAFLEEANQTIFPLITGASGVLSFNSGGHAPEKVCWKCSLLGKFVPVNGFYYTSGDNVFVFLPYSASFDKMMESFGPLHEAEYTDPNMNRNFEHQLGGYFQHSFEVAFAFLHTIYRKILCRKKSDEDDSFAMDMMKLYNLIIDKTPLEFYVIHAKKEGSTFSVKTVWPFRDSYFFYILLDRIEKSGIDTKEVMQLLVDRQEKNESMTMIRNRICERILKRKTILDLTETYVYKSELKFFRPLVDFLLAYEVEIRKGGNMTREEQEAAVALGRRIGAAVGDNDNGKRGDLYALRKTRTKVDFLEQINRLQFKLGKDLIIPPDVYEGKLVDDNFLEFKQFCMIAALNSYNAATSKERKQGGNTSEKR